jgi:hypothetical protein
VAFELARAQPGGWQRFGAYSTWLRGGAAAELGFTPSEVAGFERLSALGGVPGPNASLIFAPTELPYLTVPPSTLEGSQPVPSESDLRGYANWIRAVTGSRSTLLETGEEPPGRGIRQPERGPEEESNQIAGIAARIRILGGTVQQLRIAPGTVFLSAQVPANLTLLRSIVSNIASIWTVSNPSVRAGIDLVVESSSAQQIESIDLSQALVGIELPSNLRLNVRMGTP